MAKNRNGSGGNGRRTRAGNHSHSLTETLGELAQAKANDLNEAAHDQLSQWQADLEDRICEKPLKSVLIAAGIGLAFGLFWRR